MVKYSICITHHNNASTVRQSLEGIFSQIDESFEVIVVDNLSADGSASVLREYADSGRIKLITKRCNRGEGRQIAFENSSGDYILANLDMDDVFKPVLDRLLKLFHAECEESLLLAISDEKPSLRGFQNVTIASRRVIQLIGGWRNIQYAEDWDLWSRAAKAGRYRYTVFSFAENPLPDEERANLLQTIKSRYVRYRDLLRLGRNLFFHGEDRTLFQVLISSIAKITSPFYESYRDPFNRTFEPYDPQYLLRIH